MSPVMPDMGICPWLWGFRGTHGDKGALALGLETFEASEKKMHIIALNNIINKKAKRKHEVKSTARKK